MPESRLERDIEDLAVRVRSLEGLDSAAQRGIVQEFRELQTLVREIDREGARTTREHIKTINDQIAQLWKRIDEVVGIEHREREAALLLLSERVDRWDDDRAALRRSFWTAIIVTTVGIAGSAITAAITWTRAQVP